MNCESFFFYTSKFFFKTWFALNEYVPVVEYINYIIEPCRKKIISGSQHDSEIFINQVYYRPVNNHHLTGEKHLVYGVIDKDNIKNVWKKIEEQRKHRPNVGDMVEVHYTVPVKLNNHHLHIPYYVSYVFPSNIHFPP